MAGVKDAPQLGSFILGVACKIQDLGDNWYRASEAWKQFPLQVKQLQEKLEFWDKAASDRGMSKDAVVIGRLEEARSFLEKEQRKLEKRLASRGSGCCPLLSTTLFPAKLGLSIQRAINAFDKIPEELRLQDEGLRVLDNARKRKPYSDRIEGDSRYVPLKLSEARVYEALDNDEGPSVVLLHGGAGKGKSTLARHTVVHYRSQADKPRFEHVLFLECGSGARAEDIQFTILLRLGFEPSATPQDEELSRHERIAKDVKDCLSSRAILLILDDVSDGEVLQSIVVLCGSGVKCLVTSQLKDLCRSLYPSEVIGIQIQDIDQEDARKILASHIGFSNQQIPTYLQGVADKMIAQTELNPLALASLANGVDHGRSHELGEWETASADFFEMLRSRATALFHGSYLESFWASMELSIQKLNEDSRKVLLLTHACAGPSVPEEVVQLLYRSSRLAGNAGTFSSVRRELENRQLIKITYEEDESNDLGRQRTYTWVVHSLQKQYFRMTEAMTIARNSIFTTLLASEDIDADETESDIISEIEQTEENMITILCALYLDEDLANRAALKMHIPLEKVPEKFKSLRRDAIEPITRLLGHPRSGRWTETAHICTRKVLMDYICNNKMDNSSVPHLLALPIATLSVYKALHAIAMIEDTSLLDESCGDIVTALVSRLGDSGEGIRALGVLSYNILQSPARLATTFVHNSPGSTFLLNSPGVLDAFVNLLGTSSSPEVQTICVGVLVGLTEIASNATKAFLNAGIVGSENELSKILNVPELDILSALANPLLEDSNPFLQALAAMALRNVASGDNETKKHIVNHEARVLLKLVKSLSKDSNPSLQRYAAKALANLAGGDAEMKELLIKNCPHLLPELVKSLSNHSNVISEVVRSSSVDHRFLQANAACALSNLAAGDFPTKLRIIYEPKALLGLVNALSKDAQPGVQGNAALTLANLAEGDDVTKMHIITHESGVLLKLVESLSKDSNPRLQNFAAKALANLAGGVVETKQLLIKNCPDLLSELVRSLSNHSDVISEVVRSSSVNERCLQANAAYALSNLAGGDFPTKLRIAYQPDAVVALGNSLSKDAQPGLQVFAAEALANLAEGDDETKKHIISHKSALLKLVESLSKDSNPRLQNFAANALANLQEQIMRLTSS